MNFDEFKSSIRKITGPRNHKIKNSYGVYDAYKYIRKNNWFNIGKPVSEKEFYKIIRTVNRIITEKLISSGEVQLPNKMGSLEILKSHPRISIENGKLIMTNPIDWDATLKLWYEDPEAKDRKQLVRIENDDIFRVHYNKTKATYNNRSYYDFRPMRDFKRTLTKLARKGNLQGFLKQYYD